jgi:imidazolonepropionase-like amidohydrolase
MTPNTFAFVNANVIPMDEDRVLSDQTVIVKYGRITELGAAQNTNIPYGSIEIDASGQYLIPALSDMHIHLEGQAWNLIFPPGEQFSSEDLDFSKILFPYIANGVTTVQVMSALPEHIPLRDQINRTEILGPRLILNRMVDGPDRAWPPPISTWVNNSTDSRQVVIEAKEMSYDGIKVYSFLNRDCFDAILAAANEVGLPVVGHIPDALSVEYILEAGQKLIAHSEEVMKQAHGKFDAEQIDYFASIIADSDAWITPTLTTSRKILAIFDNLQGELAAPATRFMHPMGSGIWSYLIENIYLKIPPEHHQAIREGFESFQRPFTKALHDQGCKLMAGTDALIPTNIPGFSIHDELEELVGIGMTPFKALRTATSFPKEYLGEPGTLGVGILAELVLLEANPLEDISSTRKIQGIMYQGSWMDRVEIDERLNNLY